MRGFFKISTKKDLNYSIAMLLLDRDWDWSLKTFSRLRFGI